MDALHAGGIGTGVLSDVLNARALSCVVSLVLAVPSVSHAHIQVYTRTYIHIYVMSILKSGFYLAIIFWWLNDDQVGRIAWETKGPTSHLGKKYPFTSGGYLRRRGIIPSEYSRYYTSHETRQLLLILYLHVYTPVYEVSK